MNRPRTGTGRAWIALATIVGTLLVSAGPVGAAVQEDSKRWDCRTMGDLECGPGLKRYCDRTGLRYCNTARACRRIANRPHPLPGRRLAWSCEVQ